MLNKQRVICTCGHLNVNAGEIGIVSSVNESLLVQWNNGITEDVELDNIEFLTKRNKKAYVVSYSIFKKVFLNKKIAQEFYRLRLGKFNVKMEVINLEEV